MNLSCSLHGCSEETAEVEQQRVETDEPTYWWNNGDWTWEELNELYGLTVAGMARLLDLKIEKEVK